MNTDPRDRHSNPLQRAQEIPSRVGPVISVPQHQDLDQVLVPGSTGLTSGLLGLNLVLLGAALITGRLLNSGGQQNQEAQIFLLLLMGASVVWMLWHLLWARKQPDMSPHQDPHAGGVAATMVLVLYAALSILLCVCMIGYLITKMECKPVPRVVSSFIEALFLALQTFLLWHHSKDCIHRHKILTRVGLILVLSTDVLLWLNGVTEDTVHQEIELEEEGSASGLGALGISNMNLCQCGTTCLVFRKGVEILYPFSMEFYLTAACMIYITWKNVGRQASPGHHQVTQKLSLDLMRKGRVVYGLVSGALVLLVGLVLFILYQMWVSQQQFRDLAFFMLYVYNLAVIPVMSLCCLVGLLVHRLERHAKERGYNPTRNLDVVLLIATASGQLALCYFSSVAVLTLGAQGSLASLDLSYSILTMLEILLQSTFIIEGLHRHPNLLAEKKEKRHRRKFKSICETSEDRTEDSGLEADTAVRVNHGSKSWAQRIIKETRAFLVLTNVMMWLIHAFGAHPQFENGFGKTFYGFSAWFVLVNLSQPLSVFYRMHSVSELMELLLSE